MDWMYYALKLAQQGRQSCVPESYGWMRNNQK